MVIFSFEYQRFSTAFGNLVVQPPFMCSTAGSHCRNGRQNVCSLGQKRWVQPSAEASKVERKTYADMGLKIWELPLFSKDYHHFFQFNVHILDYIGDYWGILSMLRHTHGIPWLGSAQAATWRSHEETSRARKGPEKVDDFQRHAKTSRAVTRSYSFQKHAMNIWKWMIWYIYIHIHDICMYVCMYVM